MTFVAREELRGDWQRERLIDSKKSKLKSCTEGERHRADAGECSSTSGTTESRAEQTSLFSGWCMENQHVTLWQLATSLTLLAPCSLALTFLTLLPLLLSWLSHPPLSILLPLSSKSVALAL